MGFEGKETEVEVLFFKDEFVANKVHGEAQNCIRPPANSITKGLLRHPFAERWVKKVDEPNDIPGNSFHFRCV